VSSGITCRYALPQVLIHAGTGGVGQAAVEVCSALGAAITATAGSAQKRTCLRAAGVPAAAGSRDASFVDVIACRGSPRNDVGPQLHYTRFLSVFEAVNVGNSLLHIVS